MMAAIMTNSDEPRSNAKPSQPDSSTNAVKATMPEQAKPQADKFKELARELEVDEDEARFEDAVRKIAKAPAPQAPDKE